MAVFGNVGPGYSGRVVQQPNNCLPRDVSRPSGQTPSPILAQQTAPAFDPIQLFIPGLRGAWWDVSDTGTLFQSGTRSSPGAAVTADGDPVGLVLDKSGNGYDLVQATSTKRPLYRTSGGLSWLEFDGVDDFLSVASFDLSAYAQVAFCLAFTPTSASTMVVSELGPDVNSTAGTFYLAAANDIAAGQISFAINGSSGADGVETTATTYGSGVTSVFSTQAFDLSSASATARMPIRRNGASEATTLTTDTGAAGTTFSAQTLYVGARAGTSLFFKGKWFGQFIRGRGLESSEISSLDSWMLVKAGLAGTTYNDNLTESAAAADSLSTVVTFVSADTESVTANDALSNALTTSGSLNEAVTPGASLATTMTFVSAAAESAAAGAALANQAIMGASEAESAGAADSVTAGQVMPNALGEQATAADAGAAAQTMPSALGEGADARDSVTAGTIYNDVISEQAAADMSLGVGLSLPAAVAEQANATDVVTGAQLFRDVLAESAVAVDQLIADVIPGALGKIKVFDGATFAAHPVKVWMGEDWAVKPLKRWNGSAWV